LRLIKRLRKQAHAHYMGKHLISFKEYQKSTVELLYVPGKLYNRTIHCSSWSTLLKKKRNLEVKDMMVGSREVEHCCAHTTNGKKST